MAQTAAHLKIVSLSSDTDTNTTHTHTHTAHTHTNTHTHIHTHTHTCIRTQTHTCSHACMHTQLQDNNFQKMFELPFSKVDNEKVGFKCGFEEVYGFCMHQLHV